MIHRIRVEWEDKLESILKLPRVHTGFCKVCLKQQHRSVVMQRPPLKVLFCGTHPVQTNGYSKVVFELARHVAALGDVIEQNDIRPVELSIFGFQKHGNPVKGLVEERSIQGVTVYDALSNEAPRASGFGFTEFRQYVVDHRPDVVVVFNDMSVLCGMIDRLKNLPERGTFKVIAYIDQVYMSQKRMFIEFVNANADAAIAFTPYWEANLRKIGIQVPTSFLRHGLNPLKVFPVPKALARKYFGFAEDDFLVLNLNRNQPRKRWDKSMQALAEVIAREPDSKIRMVVAAELRGAFDILEIFERELGKWGLSLVTGMRHFLQLKTPHAMSDGDINALYNAVDIGINTCDGEGFGLCNFENAAVCIPQVVPAVGGFLDFFDGTCAFLVKPRTTFYIDCTHDSIGGEAHMCDKSDFADGILQYYKDPELRTRHGNAARKRIVSGYRWPEIASKFRDIVNGVAIKRLPEGLDSTREEVDRFLAGAHTRVGAC